MLEEGSGLWQAGDFLWGQDASGGFKLLSFRGRAVHALWSGREGETLAAAALDAQGKGFPSTFKFSPTEGREGGLLQQAIKVSQVSLPPFAQKNNDRAGVAVTDHNISIEGLSNQAEAKVRPSCELPVPSRGRHHFVVGNFGLARPLLLSYELSSGSFYCWIPHERKWEELSPEGSMTVGGYMQPDLSWSMHVVDAECSGTLLVPTESGLARVDINLLSLTYSVDYLSSLPCLAGVIEFQSDLFALVGDPQHPQVLQFQAAQADQHKIRVHDISGMPAGGIPGHLRLPFKTKRELYWLSERGQIRVKADVAGKLSVSLIAWPAGMAPRFNLGGPYVHSDGRVWQQCVDTSADDPDEHGYCFVEIGKLKPERKRVGAYRLMGGLSFLVKDQRSINQAPWDAVSGGLGDIKRITVPLLESTTGSKPMICFSTAFNGDPDVFFAEDATMEVSYLFWGHIPNTPNHRCVFHFDRAATPWDARVLIYEDQLFLYDPDSSGPIQGWKIA